MDRSTSPKRPQTAHTTNMLNSRVLDNHFDPRVHPRAWIAPGALPGYKYNYDDTGLAYVIQKSKKLKNFPDKYEQYQEVSEKMKNFRNFKEYETLLNNEILITIEYCTNCKQHQSSTRHDEEKYAYFANELKRQILSQYPICKVLLKPLLFLPNDHSTETLYLRSRIGALEVQLCSKDGKGDTKKALIYSKLNTRQWPSVPLVVQNISNYLPKDDFVVRLYDPNFDPSTVKQQDGSPSRKVNKLKGISVILRPVKVNNSQANLFLKESDMFGSKNFGESYNLNSMGTSRPTSGAGQRPKSAYSATSSKAGGSMRNTMNSNKSSTKQRDLGFFQQSDEFGVVFFKQIPHNVYELEVVETHNYLPEKRIINIFDLVEQGLTLKEEIELRPQTMCFCKIKLVDRGMPVSEATIVIAKKDQEDDPKKTAILREKDHGTGVYEFMIDAGVYRLSITRLGYNELQEEIVAQQGENNYEIQMKQGTNKTSTFQSNDRPKSRETTASGRTRPESSKGRYSNYHNNPDKGSIGSVNFEGSRSPERDEVIHEEKPKQERVKSALVKKIEVRVFNVDTDEPIQGANVIVEEIGFKASTNQEGKVLLPVNKLTDGQIIINHGEFFGIMEDYGQGGIDLKNINEKAFALIPRPVEDDEVQIRFIPGAGKKCMKFTVLADDETAGEDFGIYHGPNGKEVLFLKNLTKKRGVVRILGQIENINAFMNPETTVLLCRSQECEPIMVHPIPNEVKNKGELIWDIGFFANPTTNPQFVEINAYTNEKISVVSYLKEYQTLLNYLVNSKTDIKTLLGFKGKDRVEKNGDIFVTKNTIYASLDKYGLEIRNADHLLASALRENGLYSYAELERRFAHLKPPFNFIDAKLTSDEEQDDEYV